MDDFPSQSARPQNLSIKTQIAVIGAGQAGLSAAYYLKRNGLVPGTGFLALDDAEGPGGAWRERWPSLTLSTVNRIHDLPGLGLEEAVPAHGHQVMASTAVPQYFKAYEEHFELGVLRPVKVDTVTRQKQGYRITTNSGTFSARGLINATGTWQTPYIPSYPGAETFEGEQLHTANYKTAERFIGKRVAIIGAGISAIQLLDEISLVTDTLWLTRRPPDFREGPFDAEAGREAVAMVEERVRKGLRPNSVVSVTGLPVNERVQAMRSRGVLNPQPIFSQIVPHGLRWQNGRFEPVDIILWCTGFRFTLSHLADLDLLEQGGGIKMKGRLATEVARDPKIHLVGYGPSASTIGANRAGRAAANELMSTLGLR